MCRTQRLGTGSKHVCGVCARVCVCVFVILSSFGAKGCVVHVCVCCMCACALVPLSVPLLPLYTSTPVPLFLWPRGWGGCGGVGGEGPSYAPLLLCRSSFSGFSLDFNWLPQELIGLSIDWSVSSTQHRGRYMLRQNKSLRDVSVLSSETGRACQHPVCMFN